MLWLNRIRMQHFPAKFVRKAHFFSPSDDGLDADGFEQSLSDLSLFQVSGPASGDSPSAAAGIGTESTGEENSASETPTAVVLQGETYWSLSRTPLTSLVFTLPLVLAYEGGVLLLGRSHPRNGADVWLRQLLDGVGLGAYFLLPVLTVLGLLAWHHIEHDRWRYSSAVLLGMAGECLLWAVALVGLAQLQENLWSLQTGAAWEGILARLIGFCGAGLYEEVLFRLLLLPLVVWVLQRLGFSMFSAGLCALLSTSLLFSAAHYVGPDGDTLQLYSFFFRTMAGIFFAALFLLRGFGIAAGTHAAYDLVIGIV